MVSTLIKIQRLSSLKPVKFAIIKFGLLRSRTFSSTSILLKYVSRVFYYFPLVFLTSKLIPGILLGFELQVSMV